ncbi:MAG: NUDIX hydrolase [Pseudomonadota bacterium]
MPADEKRPLIGVGVVVWRGDKVLLVKRGKPPRKGSWGLPGGRQEWGETVFQAAQREVMEETGLTIEPLDYLTVVDGITHGADGEIDFHYTLVEVLARWISGEAVAADDADDVRWADPDRLEMLDWDKTREVILLGRERMAARNA